MAADAPEAGAMAQRPDSSITWRIAVDPQQGRKVFTFQTLPVCDEPFDDGVGKVAGRSLHVGVVDRRRVPGLAGSTPVRSSAVSQRTPT